jgi:predicted nucleic-acid-binding protein
LRYLLRDDEVQYQTVRALLLQPRSYSASITVMLELAWMLKTQGWQRADVVAAFTALLDALPNFQPQSANDLRRAVAAYGQGMDFADALHLVLSHSAEADAFATADRHLAKQAEKQNLQPPVELVRFPS